MHKAAGGPSSRQVVSKPVRTGSGSFAKSVKGVSQIGTSVGNHVTGKGKILRNTQRDLAGGANFQPVKFGNEIALNVGKGGCGTGRTIYQSGSQRGLQPARPMPKGRSFDD